jgi:trk system potassium uptake protein
MVRKSRSFVVVGLGAFGGTVATALAGMGDEVLGIARDEDALKEAGAGQHDVAIISIGEDLEASILATMNVKLIGVPTIWVKALSRTHHRILSKIGVDRVIRPEHDMGLHVAETLHSPYVADYLSLGNGFHVINFIIPEVSKLKTIGDLRKLTGEKVQILGVMKGSEFQAGREDETVLMGGDRIMLLGRRKDLRQLAAGV